MTGVLRKSAKAVLQRVTPLSTKRLVKFLRKSQMRVEKVERNVDRLALLALRQKYPDLLDEAYTKSVINRHELSVYSQNGEDGILLYIFSQIGVTNRGFVEFGIEDGRECNTANLSINFGWHGLLMDISASSVMGAQQYYRAMLGPRRDSVNIIECMVTAENINQTLADNGVEPEPDLLCIDIDSNDYHVWNAINVIQPRVVVMEYNPAYGPERSLTVKYQPAFDRFGFHPTGFYYGASVTALTKLAERKGYSLVGCDTTGINAFFVRNDALAGDLQPLPAKRAFYRDMRFYSDVRQDGNLNPVDPFELIQHLEFDEIV